MEYRNWDCGIQNLENQIEIRAIIEVIMLGGENNTAKITG